MKNKKWVIIGWNAFVDSIPIWLPLVIHHKDAIIRNVKKIKI
jgi:hypothetical protein